MTLLNDPRPISADSHALEGPEVFEGLPEQFGDDAPRVVHKDGRGDFIMIPNMPRRSRNVAYMALAGTRLDYDTPLPREHASKPSATMVELIVRGVCTKFPKLKFVLAEFNAGWVAHWLDKVQQGWAREYAKDSSGTGMLSRRTSRDHAVSGQLWPDRGALPIREGLR